MRWLEKPEYVFRDTPQHLIQQHYQRLTTFVGYPELKVAEAEARLGVNFPAVFRQYLLEMASRRETCFRGAIWLASLSSSSSGPTR